MASSPLLRPGRILLTLVALTTLLGAYLADFNDTHILNPYWTPHAKFHNGQTMSFALVLGLSTLWFLYAPTPSTPAAAYHQQQLRQQQQEKKSTAAKQDNGADAAAKQHVAAQRLRFVALLASMYWITQMSAYLYPGVAPYDTDVPRPERINTDYWLQLKLELAMLGMTGVGYWLEKGRLD